jgi:hypothetical protein
MYADKMMAAAFFIAVVWLILVEFLNYATGARYDD